VNAEYFMSFLRRFFLSVVTLGAVVLAVLASCGGTSALSNCTTNSDCSKGYQCISGECGLPPTTACPGAQTSCGGTCVDTTSDPKNCGSCGQACAAG